MTDTNAQWDNVEQTLLTAMRQPALARGIADASGLTPDVVKNQLEVLRDAGLVIQVIADGLRYKLTLAGWKRLFTLTGTSRTQRAA
ncbi:hypothetical protein [Spirillospora sp. NBC_01491]|uniref:hypothetical protein n=1 Tax=Spirillospora sp. NBC_01491 TaxID=2976007 RepID=UPI002E342BDE|nr:hypothetical protein [Spirillospora sp. NBC_01491]